MVKMLEHRVAVITGSNTGVGLSVAKRLLEEAKGKISLTVRYSCVLPVVCLLPLEPGVPVCRSSFLFRLMRRKFTAPIPLPYICNLH